MPVAMKLSMIVETTSFTPRVTLSAPAMAAYPPAAAMATRTMNSTWSGPGRVTTAPAAAAKSAPMRYCPSAPMLNRPILKPRATARPMT